MLEDGGTESEAIAGLLHDAIEDAHVKPKKIRQAVRTQGGAHRRRLHRDPRRPVADEEARRPRDSSTWRARKQESLAHLRDPDTPTAVLRVKAADALANARSIVADLRRHGPEVWQRFHAGAVDQLWYYRSLALVLAQRHPGPVTDELRATVREMEQLARWWFDVGDPQPGGD